MREGKGAIQEIGGPRENRGEAVWHSRGYLPHFEGAEAIQHVTFHLADSLPRTAILRIEAETKALPAEKRDDERRRRMEAWIDAGHGSCILREPEFAGIVQGALLAFDSRRYRLLAWVVMPNHVHVLFQPMNGWAVAKTVASWKKFTARVICEEPSKSWQASCSRVAPGVLGPLYTRPAALSAGYRLYSRKPGESGVGCFG